MLICVDCEKRSVNFVCGCCCCSSCLVFQIQIQMRSAWTGSTVISTTSPATALCKAFSLVYGLLYVSRIRLNGGRFEDNKGKQTDFLSLRLFWRSVDQDYRRRAAGLLLLELLRESLYKKGSQVHGIFFHVQGDRPHLSQHHDIFKH